MTTNNTLAAQRTEFFRMIRPDIHRVMLAYDVMDLDGRWYHHFHVRGNTLICVPGSLNQNHKPLGVTTWQVSDIVQGMQQALAESIIDDATFETIDHTLTCMFDGCYVDTDYMCPGIAKPSQYNQLRTMFDELGEHHTWTWEQWLELERHMNKEGIVHGYYHEEEDHDDVEFMRHIDETVTLVATPAGLDDFSLNGFEIGVDITGAWEFDYDTGYASEISI